MKSYLFVVALMMILVSCTSEKTEYYPDGKIKSVISYRDNKKEGPATYYYPGGLKELEVNYTNDQLDGWYQKFDVNGQLLEKTFYENGLRNGVSEQYYPNRSLMSQAAFRHDTLHGPFTEYHPNGQIRVSGRYMNGLYDSTWSYFSIDGIKVGYAQFDQGTGEQVALHYGSKIIKQRTPYLNNQKHGQEISYDSIGNPVQILHFDHDKLIKRENPLK